MAINSVVFIQDSRVNYNLMLMSDTGVKFCIKTKTFADRERLVSILLTLRGFCKERAPNQFDKLRISTLEPNDVQDYDS